MSKKRFSAVKYDEPPSACYFCKKMTVYALLDEKDGSEVFCCDYCLYKEGKIKRFHPKTYIFALNRKKWKIQENLRIKKRKVAKLEEGLDHD